MKNLIYHSVEPQNKRQVYNPLFNLDFNLDFQGRKLIPGSVRLEGVVLREDRGAVFNSRLGSHALIDSLSVQIDNAGGIVEDLQDYGHYVLKKIITSRTDEELGYNASHLVALQSANQTTAKEVVQLGSSNNGANNLTENTGDFSMKPYCVLNNALMESGSMNYSKTGMIKLSVRLADGVKALENTDNGNVSYIITDLRICYITEMEDDDTRPIVVEGIQTVKSTVEGNFTSLNASVVGAVRNVSVTFQDVLKENNPLTDEYQTFFIPQIERVEFLFNDATNTMITYNIDNNVEILDRFVESMNRGNRTHNSLGVINSKNNQAFGLGLDFGGYIPLDSNKIRVVITSGLNTTGTLNAYMCFKTRLSF